MTMTETRPRDDAGADGPAAPTASGDATQPGGLLGVFGSGDPSIIGRLWISTSLLFLLGTGALGTLVGAEGLKVKTYDIFDAGSYGQALSLLSVAAVFLAAIPLLIGVATVVVPGQVGAKTIAFPRAAAAAYWTYLLGSVLVVVSYLINGGPFGGNEHGVDLFLAALLMVCVALILASTCLVTTILALRAPGLSLARVPAFTWSILVGATVWVGGLAVLSGLLVLLYVDHRYRAFNFGGNFDIDSWLIFTRTQPQIYAVGIPVLGFAADVVPVLARRAQKRHGIVLGAVGLLGACSFGGWTFYQNHAPDITHQLLYVALAFAAIVPVLVVLGGLVEALFKGKPSLKVPLAFGLASVLMLGAGVAAGALRAVHPFKLVGTTADTSVAVYVIGAAALAGIGAVHWWWPQIMRQPLKAAIGTLTALTLLAGTILWSLPLLVAGFLDEPRAQIGAGYVPRDGVESLNAAAAVGAALFTLGVLLFIVNVLASLGSGEAEPAADPWDGFTLEWSDDPSAVPVTSATPLLDQKEATSA